jgi:ABC-type phosphate transport system substrate-binding protein
MKRIILLLAAALAVQAGSAQAQEFKVVVNASTGVTSIGKDELAKIFLKKARKLPGGTDAVPVDNDSDVRAGFSQAVHGRGETAIESFWQQQIFSGKDVPPEKKPGDSQVLDYVRSTPGAIGYVSGSATVGSGVTVVTVTGL